MSDLLLDDYNLEINIVGIGGLGSESLDWSSKLDLKMDKSKINRFVWRQQFEVKDIRIFSEVKKANKNVLTLFIVGNEWQDLQTAVSDSEYLRQRGSCIIAFAVEPQTDDCAATGALVRLMKSVDGLVAVTAAQVDFTSGGVGEGYGLWQLVRGVLAPLSAGLFGFDFHDWKTILLNNHGRVLRSGVAVATGEGWAIRAVTLATENTLSGVAWQKAAR